MWEQLIWALASGVISGVLVAVFTAIFNRKYSKAAQRSDEETENRKKQSKLNLNLTFAGTQLSYACAMAIKRGAPNGEIEEAVKAYNKAIKQYRDFERELVAEATEK